jgi:hypothetical protein
MLYTLIKNFHWTFEVTLEGSAYLTGERNRLKDQNLDGDNVDNGEYDHDSVLSFFFGNCVSHVLLNWNTPLLNCFIKHFQ